MVWDMGQAGSVPRASVSQSSGVLGTLGAVSGIREGFGSPGASPAAHPFAACRASTGMLGCGGQTKLRAPQQCFPQSPAGGHLSRLCSSLILQTPSQSIRAPFPGREDTSSQTLPPSQTSPAGMFPARPHPCSSQRELGASSEGRVSLVQAWQPDVEQGEPGKGFDPKSRG